MTSWTRCAPRSPLGGRGTPTSVPETLGEMVAAERRGCRCPCASGRLTSDVRSFYEEEGRAGVLTLNLDDLARYEKPRILMAGDRKIGVVAVDYYASARQLEKLHDELASAGAESAPSASLQRLSCLVSTDDFNVVIVADDDQAEPGRGEGENAHIVYAPERGQVGVVLLHVPERPPSKVCASLLAVRRSRVRKFAGFVSLSH